MIVWSVVLLTLFVLWVGFACHVSYTSEGGQIGMVPVFAHAIGTPFLLILWLTGIGALAKERHAPGAWHLPWWTVPLVYVGGVVVVGWLIFLAGELGARAHRRAAGAPVAERPRRGQT